MPLIDGALASVIQFRTAVKFWQIYPLIPDEHGPQVEEKDDYEEKEITRGGQNDILWWWNDYFRKHVEVDDIEGLPLAREQSCMTG